MLSVLLLLLPPLPVKTKARGLCLCLYSTLSILSSTQNKSLTCKHLHLFCWFYCSVLMAKQLENKVTVTTDYILHAAHSGPSDISKDFFSEFLLFPDGQTNFMKQEPKVSVFHRRNFSGQPRTT